MKKSYSIGSFKPKEATLALIRQFAYTYRTIQVGDQYIAFSLN